MTPQELRGWRQALDLSQEQAAHALGVTLRGYTKWESGETPIAERVKLAAQMYLRLHRTTWGNRRLPLLYIARIYENQTNRTPIDHYFLFARNEHEASKLVYEELGSPPQLTLEVEAIADAPREATPQVLGSMAEIAGRPRAKPPARLAPIAGRPGKRKLGSLEGKLRIPEDFDAPLPDWLLDAFEGVDETSSTNMRASDDSAVGSRRDKSEREPRR